MTKQNNEWVVDEAGRESFPASDPPAWGSSRAAPSASTVVPKELRSRKRKQLAMRIALAAFGAGALVGAVFAIRYLRAR